MKMSGVTLVRSNLNKVKSVRIYPKKNLTVLIVTQCLLFGATKIGLKTAIQKILNNRNKQQ